MNESVACMQMEKMKTNTMKMCLFSKINGIKQLAVKELQNG